MASSRRLTEADIEIWLKVVQTVLPRPGAAVPARAATQDKTSPRPEPTPEPSRRATAPSYSPPISTPSVTPVAAFDRRFKKKVAGGRVGIDDMLDLHGLTQREAHDALLNFLLRAHRNDARLVLVVTGKGRTERSRLDGGGEAGVLRRVVPAWLRGAALRGVVLGFEEAARPHGGAGALYIRLRRREANA